MIDQDVRLIASCILSRLWQKLIVVKIMPLSQHVLPKNMLKTKIEMVLGPPKHLKCMVLLMMNMLTPIHNLLSLIPMMLLHISRLHNHHCSNAYKVILNY